MLFFFTFFSELNASQFSINWLAQLFQESAYKNDFSEGSCDTEDWSNDAENSALCHRNKYNFKIYKNTKMLCKL